MSHISKVELYINDLSALGKACKRLGVELAMGQKNYKWYGRSYGQSVLPAGFTAADMGRCDHAIKVPGNSQAYEIGVCQRKDGQPGYTLLTDFFNGGYGMEAKVGEGGDKLKQAYAAEVAEDYFDRLGYKVTEERQADGSVLMRATN